MLLYSSVALCLTEHDATLWGTEGRIHFNTGLTCQLLYNSLVLVAHRLIPYFTSISKVKMSLNLTWSPRWWNRSKIRYLKINKAQQNFNKMLKWKRKWLFARLIHCIIKRNWMWHERFPVSVLVTAELNQSIKFCDLPLHYLKCSIWSQSQNQPFWLVLSVLLVSLALMLFPQQTIAKCTVLATDRKCAAHINGFQLHLDLEPIHQLFVYDFSVGQSI